MPIPYTTRGTDQWEDFIFAKKYSYQARYEMDEGTDVNENAFRSPFTSQISKLYLAY